MNTLYSIGHSTHAIDVLIDLLARHAVDAVADVRSSPYSRYNPQFNREPLRVVLREASISYVYLGQELGARTDDRSCYVDGKVQYDLLAETATFREGLDRLEEGASDYLVAVLCAEKDPLTCHRGVLIARAMVTRGFEVLHILEDGELESQEDAVVRLLGELRLPDADLFRTREEIVDDAYRRRGEQIAYVDRVPTDRDGWEGATAEDFYHRLH